MNNKAIRKELTRVRKQERKVIYRAASNDGSFIADVVNSRIPKKIKAKLDGAFSKAFSLIYTKGSSIIMKTYSRTRMEEKHAEDMMFAKAQGSSFSVRSFEANSKRRGLLDGIIICGTGTGLGLLGRGIISIPMFVSITFRNIYQTALCYGYDPKDKTEQFLMLAMMEAAISTGEYAEEIDEDIEEMIDFIDSGRFIADEMQIENQIERVSSKLSEQILYLKALQVIPVAGAVFGFADVHFYSKVHKYIDIKYRKRFLLSQVK